MSGHANVSKSTWYDAMLTNMALWVCLQYEAQIDAIVEQAQHVGRPDEGLWCCTI